MISFHRICSVQGTTFFEDSNGSGKADEWLEKLQSDMMQQQAMEETATGSGWLEELRGVTSPRIRAQIQNSVSDDEIRKSKALSFGSTSSIRKDAVTFEMCDREWNMAQNLGYYCTDEMSGSRGHWCFYHCGHRSRRLTIADELVSNGQLEQAAYTCLVLKIEDDYECLGNPEDLKVKIVLSE
jgi:hypothetical protein